MANPNELEIGVHVWRLGKDYFGTRTRDYGAQPPRTGCVIAKYHPPHVNWAHSNQADWWRFDVQWDDGEVGTGYFACGLQTFEV